MVVTHSQETCTRNLYKFFAQMPWLCVTTISLHVLWQLACNFFPA